MTLDNMTGITEGSYTGFCKRQLITCNFVKACNGVCPFEDALKHADKMQTINEKHTADHDRDWVIGCIEHDGFIHTHRFDKANQIIHDALSAGAGWIPCSERLPEKGEVVLITNGKGNVRCGQYRSEHDVRDETHYWWWKGKTVETVLAWMPLPEPYNRGAENETSSI